MKKEFKALATYIGLFDGFGKPKLNFQEMYKLFPELTFTAARDFGEYENFGKAYEAKKLNMVVTNEQGKECYLYYREYGDANENLAYVTN